MSGFGSGHEFASRRVTRELDRIVAERGLPEAIPCDNGGRSFYIAAFSGVGRWNGRSNWYTLSRDGRLQNAFVESFTGKLADECLEPRAVWEFYFEARVKISAWEKSTTKNDRTAAWDILAPREFARRIAALRSPTLPAKRQCEERKEAEVMVQESLVSL